MNGDKIKTCVICDEKALKFKYSKYGITSCLSCRAFFRRAAANGCYKTFKCQLQDTDKRGTGPCNVAKSGRRRCAKCRFDKCIKGGMSHPSLKQEDGNEKVMMSLMRAEQGSSISLYEVGRLFCQRSLETMMHIFSGAISGNTLPFSSVRVMATLLEEKIRKFSSNLDGFQQVAPSPTDRAILLERNAPAAICNRIFYFFQPDSNISFFQQVDKLNVFTFKCIPGDPGDNIRPIQWEQVFKTHWAHYDGQEVQFNFVRTTMNDLGMNQKIANILTAIVLFDTEDMDLSVTTINHEKAREFQSMYSQLLHNHLEDIHGSDLARKLHTQYLMLVKSFRTVGYFMRHQVEEVEEICPDVNLNLSSVLSDLPWSSFMT